MFLRSGICIIEADLTHASELLDQKELHVLYVLTGVAVEFLSNIYDLPDASRIS